jgi:hypothetical protein
MKLYTPAAGALKSNTAFWPGAADTLANVFPALSFSTQECSSAPWFESVSLTRPPAWACVPDGKKSYSLAIMNCAAAVGTGVGVRVAVGGTAVGVRVAVGVGGTAVAVSPGVGGTGVAVLLGVGVVGTGVAVPAGVGLGVSVKSKTPTVGIAVAVAGGSVSVASGLTLGAAVASGVIPAMGVAVLPGRAEDVLVAGGRVLVGSGSRRVSVRVGGRSEAVGFGVDEAPAGSGWPGMVESGLGKTSGMDVAFNGAAVSAIGCSVPVLLTSTAMAGADTAEVSTRAKSIVAAGTCGSSRTMLGGVSPKSFAH